MSKADELHFEGYDSRFHKPGTADRHAKALYPCTRMIRKVNGKWELTMAGMARYGSLENLISQCPTLNGDIERRAAAHVQEKNNLRRVNGHIVGSLRA